MNIDIKSIIESKHSSESIVDAIDTLTDATTSGDVGGFDFVQHNYSIQGAVPENTCSILYANDPEKKKRCMDFLSGKSKSF